MSCFTAGKARRYELEESIDRAQSEISNLKISLASSERRSSELKSALDKIRDSSKTAKEELADTLKRSVLAAFSLHVHDITYLPLPSHQKLREAYLKDQISNLQDNEGKMVSCSTLHSLLVYLNKLHHSNIW